MLDHSHHIEVIDERSAAVYRAMTGEQRLAIMFDMVRFGRQLVVQSVRDQHPDWTEEQVRKEAARRVSHGAI